MVRSGSPPPGKASVSAVWLVPPALLAVATVLAVWLVPSHTRAAVAWSGAAAVLVVGLVAHEAVRRGAVITRLREEHAGQESQLRQRLAGQEAETVRLARELLPAAVTRLHEGAVAEEALRGLVKDSRPDSELEVAHREVLSSVIDAVEAEEGLRDSAQRAFVNIARRVQAIVHQQAQDLREMQEKHGKAPDVFADLLHLDHGTALIGRLADSIAVLSGARPGRQWQQDVPLFNVLRGAMSRVMDYQRVDLHSVADVAVAGPAVEPLIHAMAELLDNATRYSPPQTRVHLTALEVQAGVAVEVEDAGVGLTEEARARAERSLAQASAGLDLDDLGETPRLGLAVVGRLAQANDFSVSLRPSAYGGVRAVLTVPAGHTALTPAPGGQVARAGTMPPVRPRTRPDGEETAEIATSRRVASRSGAVGAGGGDGASGDTGRRTAPHTGPRRVEEEEPAAVERTANGLPQRRRHSPAVSSRSETGTGSSATENRSGSGAGSPPSPARGQDPVQPGMWLAAFQSGVSGDPGAVTDSGRSGSSDSDESLGKGDEDT